MEIKLNLIDLERDNMYYLEIDAPSFDDRQTTSYQSFAYDDGDKTAAALRATAAFEACRLMAKQLGVTVFTKTSKMEVIKNAQS